VNVLLKVVVVGAEFCEVDEAGVVEDVIGDITMIVDEVTTVVVVDVWVEGGGGATTTVAVELSRQPPLTQAYPGIQQPPPGKFGQSV
jgi:hypothetical protein